MEKYEVACEFCNKTTFIEPIDGIGADDKIEYCPYCGDQGVDTEEIVDNNV